MKNTYLKVLLILCVLIFGTIATSNAQSPHNHDGGKRVRITNPSSSQIQSLKDTGIDFACGLHQDENGLVLELSGNEVEALEANNISFSVEIDNLTQHIIQRNETALPIAIAELKALKISEKKARIENQNRSASTTNTLISNVTQYEGPEEIDWKTPENFEIPSTFGGCLTYTEMLAELDEMRVKYPNLISVRKDASLEEDGSGTPLVTHGNNFTNGGQYDTWLGQTIYYVRIGTDPTDPSFDPNNDQPNKPESFYSGMTHSREVTSMMNLIYYMWYVLENYETDPDVKSLVDNHEMYFIPVANPDGLLWNEQIEPSGGGLQRKNLNPAANTGDNDLRGVDINRNYDYFWGDFAQYPGSSGTTSSNVYRGTAAMSEPESRITEAFVENHNVQTAVNHHAFSNLIPHAYNGFPASTGSGREDEFAQYNQDLTRYNRYIYGEAPDILTVANGDMSDWMLGGALDLNNSTGSGKAILAQAPENGSSAEGGFWPIPTNIVPICKRAMRMNFINALYAGKLAQFQDFTAMGINDTSTTLDFGIEYLGQTLGDIDLQVTATSDNIISVGTIPTQTSWSKLEQRLVSASLELDPSIVAGDEIEYRVTLSSGGYIIHQADLIKVYLPTILAQDDPDTNNFDNWTLLAGSWGVDTEGFQGTKGISDSPSASYGNGIFTGIGLNGTYNISSYSNTVIQFKATWDLERNFDYAQLQASRDGGTTWIPMSGKYTKPGSTSVTNPYDSSASSNTGPGKNGTDVDNQDGLLPLFEGYRLNKWAMEEFTINTEENPAFLGATNIQFRFVIRSDSSNRADGYTTTFDGFTFDDFTMYGLDIETPCSTILDIDPSYTENFTSNFGIFEQVSGDDGNWLRDDNGTPTGDTGPGTGSGGILVDGDHYVYIEASAPGTTTGGINQGNTAILQSQCIDLTTSSTAGMIFNYHMRTAGTFSTRPTLELIVSTDNGSTFSAPLTTLEGADGTGWREESVDLSAYSGQIIKLRFVGTTGSGSFQGDIAIDNIRFNAGITEYVYDAGAWSPNDPSGVATDLDNITVISGTGPLTADTAVNNVTVQNGGTLSLGITTLSVDGDFANAGAMSATDASLVMMGDTAQTISGNSFDLGSLTVDNSAGTTITGAIEINELLTLTSGQLATNGNLTLGSDVNGSAMVASITGGSITGDVTTEQYIPAKRAFRLIGSTVTTSTTIRSNWQENGSSAGGFGTHITGSTTGANGFDATGSGNYSLFTLNNPGQAWESIQNTDVNTLTTGKGYRLFIRGDRTIDVNSNEVTPTITTIRSTGALATGTITTTGSDLNHNAGGYNFISNPYQASVNVNNVIGGSTNINDSQMVIFDTTIGERGAYVTIMLNSGTGGSTNGTGNGKNYHFLQPGQAFFTTALTTVGDNSTAVVFAENDKVIGEDVAIYSPEANRFNESAHLIGRLYRADLYGTPEGLQDNFVVLYDRNADNEITTVDAPKFFNIDENLAISSGNAILSVERRAMPQEGEIVQLWNSTYRTTEYMLDIDVSDITEVTPYFVDSFTGTRTALSQGLNTLAISIDLEDDESITDDRFRIEYEAIALSINTPLGVDLAVSPNPVTEGQLTITSSSYAGQQVNIVITNILGQKVINLTKGFTGDSLTLTNLTNLQSGVYFITIKGENAQNTQKIIVQ